MPLDSNVRTFSLCEIICVSFVFKGGDKYLKSIACKLDLMHPARMGQTNLTKHSMHHITPLLKKLPNLPIGKQHPTSLLDLEDFQSTAATSFPTTLKLSTPALTYLTRCFSPGVPDSFLLPSLIQSATSTRNASIHLNPIHLSRYHSTQILPLP